MSAFVQKSRNGRRAERLRGPLALRELEVIERWRSAPAQAHARAMIELSRYAGAIARQTGLGKPRGEMFPGFPAERGGRA